MRRGNGLMLVLALIMGLAAAYLARDWIQRQAIAVPAPAASTIVVAAAPLGFGIALTPENIVEIPWATSRVPDGAFTTRDELLKDGRRVVLTPMQRNELILRTKITGPGQRASLSSLLEEGRKAVTVRVDDVRGVAGFVLPGDRVDVVLIRMENKAPGQVDNTSDILVQHVKVLAVDQIVNERQEQPTVAKAVTLEVTTEEAQKILLASNVGKLSLILRQAGQSQPEFAKRVTDIDLGFAPPAPSAAPATVGATSQSEPPVRVQPTTATVDIVRGTTRAQYNVQSSGR
jgi:pilus assembly protein CpaB